jgi:hypothetical protein
MRNTKNSLPKKIKREPRSLATINPQPDVQEKGARIKKRIDVTNNKESKPKKSKREPRSLATINPQPDVQEEVKFEEYGRSLDSTHSSLIPNFNIKTHDKVGNSLHELLNLENNNDYLSDKVLYEWKTALDSAKLFYRLLIYISLNKGLPTTKGMTQAEYFSNFNIEDYNVSKNLKYTQILVFLYLGFTKFEQIKDLNLLKTIGNENDHTLQQLINVQKQYGDEFLLKVFKECQKEVRSKSKVKKITGTLVNALAESYSKQMELTEIANNGAIENFKIVELSHLIEPASIIKHENMADTTTSKSEIGITELISNIREQKSTLSELTTNKNKYGSNEIEDLLAAIEELQDLADSLS